MMRIINKLATQSLIPSDIGSNILDFTVPVIDNFGDMGVALSLAFELLTTYPNIQIRFFSEDEVLFEKFIGRSHSLLTDWYGEVGILTRLSYHSLDSYIWSRGKYRYNFFGYPIPLDGLSGVVSIVNFDYLQLSESAVSIHLTSYLAGDTEITHFVPGYLEWLGGLTIPPRLTISRNTLFQSLDVLEDRPICLIFVYHTTLSEILPILQQYPDWHFLICGGDSEADWEMMYSHVQFLSFIPMLVFTELMRSIDRAIVRGEHSFTLAVEYQKSFLWDIYPEDNQAHIEKMRDAEYSLKKTLIITDQNLSNLLNI